LLAGDIAWRDGEGNTFVVDRLKELIKHKGFQVAPAELEGLLLQHPEVSDVAVVGAPDERAGELPVAFVVHKGVAVTANAAVKTAAEAEVKAWIQPKVAEYKVPARVLFVEAIPKSASGKILRRVLKDQVAALVAAQPEQK
jgi:4-coumarate--CoA ligase